MMICTMILNAINKASVICAIFLFSSNIVQGQSNKESLNKYSFRSTLNFDLLGFNLEYRRYLFRNTVLRFEIGPSYWVAGGILANQHFIPVGQATLELRYFPHLKKRLENIPDLLNYGGFFIGLSSSQPFQRKNTNAIQGVELYFYPKIISVDPGYEFTFLKNGYGFLTIGYGLCYNTRTLKYHGSITFDASLGLFKRFYR